MFEGWGLRPGRTAYGWTVEQVALDTFRRSAYVDFVRNDDKIRVRFRRMGETPSFAQVGPIDIFYDQIDDQAVKDEAGDVVVLLVEWFRQRGDHDALDELLASLDTGAEPDATATEDPEFES